SAMQSWWRQRLLKQRLRLDTRVPHQVFLQMELQIAFCGRYRMACQERCTHTMPATWQMNCTTAIKLVLAISFKTASSTRRWSQMDECLSTALRASPFLD